MADNVPGTWEEIFEHPRFKELIDKRKGAEQEAESLRKQLATVQQEHESALKEYESRLQSAQQGPQDELQAVKDTLHELAQRYEQTETALQQERRARTRLTVAQELGIPEFADEIRGKTPEEMQEHAQAIVERIQARVQGSAPGIAPRGRGTPAATVTAAQLSDPKWVRENQGKVLEAAANGSLPE